MRSSFLVILFFTLFNACTSGDNLDGIIDTSQYIDKVQVSIAPIKYEELESRVIVTDELSYIWQLNDTIGIFPNRGGQVEFYIEQEATSVADFDGGGWGLKDSYPYSAYYPFRFNNRNLKAIPISYLGQTFNGASTNKGDSLRNYMFYGAKSTLATKKDDIVKLELNLRHQGAVMMLELTMPGENDYKSLSIYTERDIIPIRKTIDLTSSFDATESLSHTVIESSNCLSLKLENTSTTSDNKKFVIWMAMPSMNYDTDILKVAVRDKDNQAYSGTLKTGKGNIGYASLAVNSLYRRYATLVEDENFNLDLATVTPEEWKDGGEYEETVTIP